LGQSGVVERLGFNPFDPERDTAYNRARRLVNTGRQQVVLLLGIIGLVVMALFPPWKKNDWVMEWAFIIPSSRVVNSKFVGYHFAFAEMPGPDSFSSWHSLEREHTTYVTGMWCCSCYNGLGGLGSLLPCASRCGTGEVSRNG